MIKLYFLQKKLCCAFFLQNWPLWGGTNEGYSTPFMYELTLLYVAPVLAKKNARKQHHSGLILNLDYSTLTKSWFVEAKIKNTTIQCQFKKTLCLYMCVRVHIATQPISHSHSFSPFSFVKPTSDFNSNITHTHTHTHLRFLVATHWSK